jgi:hypothetical protein
MRSKLIRLLAMAIALVVPLQGMTVVVAGQCMAFGHHESSAGAQGHGHADGGHAEHSHEAGSEAEADEGAGSDAHCGPCTACCASASIAGPARLLFPSSPTNATYIFSQFPPIGVQPDGLDRPPLAL